MIIFIIQNILLGYANLSMHLRWVQMEQYISEASYNRLQVFKIQSQFYYN